MSVSSLPLVGFCGPRVAPAGAAPLVSSLVRSALASGRGVAAGCALGVDSLAVSSALALGGAGSLSVFAAFGPSGLGSVASCSAPLSSVAAAASAGASVAWWAGGVPVRGGLLPAPARLAARSLAFVRAVAASGAGCGLVAVVGALPSSPLALRRASAGRPWVSSGSGSWSAVGAAAALGVPVVVFPLGGVAPAALPLLAGGGSWSPAAAAGLWSAGWRWSPAVAAAQPSLFSSAVAA